MKDLNLVPNLPGCYLWKDKNQQVIYVGKAKNLQRRMKQYFNGNLSPKNQLLVKNIVDFDYQITPSEVDALILEQELINEHEPKYNIRIKEAKIYPYIELTAGTNKELKVTKNYLKNGSKYFGPFPEGLGSAYRVTKFLRSLYPLNKCLKPNNNAHKPCLNYQIGLCMGQCIKTISESDYDSILKKITTLFAGNISLVQTDLNNKINQLSAEKNYESAKKLLEQGQILKTLASEQSIIFKNTLHRDVIAWEFDQEVISISIAYIRFGRLSFTKNWLFKDYGIDELQQQIESFLIIYYHNNFLPDEIIIQQKLVNIEKLFITTSFVVPIFGLKKQLLKNTLNDAISKLASDKLAYLTMLNNQITALEDLEKLFNIPKLTNLEMVDISNFAGAQTVGAVINYQNGVRNPNLYRKYLLEEAQSFKNDYEAIYITTYRHFRQKLMTNQVLPDLYIVDGKHQLTAAKRALTELNLSLIVIGLIKDDCHNTKALFTEDGDEIDLKLHPQIYLFLRQIQDEVHRFVITYHKNVRTKSILTTSLHQYKFLNDNDINDLFNYFGTIRKIRIASKAELTKVISKNKADKLFINFKEQTK